MISSFSTALSGLNAMSTAINIVGNNLANLTTTGYKDNRASFKDLVSQSVYGNDSSQVGLGTTAPLTQKIFAQGTVTHTQAPFDAAINGDGFFVVKNSTGSQMYTRDGSFTVDENGYLTTSTGDRVQGWPATNGVVSTAGGVADIQIPIGKSLPPSQTTQFSLSGNLDAAASLGSADATVTQQVNAIDSLGNTVPLNVTISKDTVVSGQWNYNITGPSGTAVTGGTGSLQFDSSGVMTSPTLANGSVPVSVSGLSDGAANMSMSWDLYDKTTGVPKFTQFSEASGIASNSQNGQPAAERTGVTLSDEGKIIATYSNGAQQQVVSQLALASIRNPESLVDVGLNNFSLGADTAPPAIGTAGTGGRGAIDGGSLEGSTVDIASEFSNLLVYQRSYQADSRVVTVSDSLAQEAVNLIHS